MAFTQSLTLITASENAEAANAYFAAIGWGGPVFVVQLSPNGQLPVTHLGAHAFETPEFVATLTAAKASNDPALSALDLVFIHGVQSQQEKFTEAIAGQGGSTIIADLGSTLSRYYPPDEF